MLIDQDTPNEALLCVTAISPEPNERGLYWTEFYPVDSLLELQYADRILQGHPLLDLNPDSEKINVMGEALRPKVARDLAKWCQLGYFIALRKIRIRGKDTGRVSFIKRQGGDYLTVEQLAWLDAMAASGTMVYEELAGISGIACFCRWLYKQAKVKPKKVKKPKPKLKRKDRRRLENTIDLSYS